MLRWNATCCGGRSTSSRPAWTPRPAAAIAALTALRDTAAVPAIAAHLNDRSTDTKWNAKLALDALAGPARGLPEWQEWARGKGYLPANGTKQ